MGYQPDYMIPDPGRFDPIARRELANGRVADVNPLIGARARLSVGPKDQCWYSDEW